MEIRGKCESSEEWSSLLHDKREERTYTVIVGGLFYGIAEGHLAYSHRSYYAIKRTNSTASAFWSGSLLKAKPVLRLPDGYEMEINIYKKAKPFEKYIQLGHGISIKRDILKELTGKTSIYFNGKYVGWFRLMILRHEFTGEIVEGLREEEIQKFILIIFAYQLSIDYQSKIPPHS